MLPGDSIYNLLNMIGTQAILVLDFTRQARYVDRFRCARSLGTAVCNRLIHKLLEYWEAWKTYMRTIGALWMGTIIRRQSMKEI